MMKFRLLTPRENAENFLRNTYSGTDRIIVREYAKRKVRELYSHVTVKLFDEIFDNLIAEGYIVKSGPHFVWETITADVEVEG